METIASTPLKSVEVTQRQWGSFCERLEQFCRGTMATVHIENGSVTKTIAEGVPLRRFALDEASDPCNTNLLIELGAPGQKSIQHTVLEPIHIRLKSGTQPDRYNRVQILAENGTTTPEVRPGLNKALLRALEL